MVCKQCQTVLAEGSIFCHHCGWRVETDPQQASSEGAVHEMLQQCGYCGHAMSPGATFCGYCGNQVSRARVEQVSQGQTKPKKTRNTKKMILLSITLVLVLAGAVLALALALGWFTDRDPGSEIVAAVKNTLDSKSFTVTYTADYEYADGDIETISGTLSLFMDPDSQELMIHGIQNDPDGEEYTWAVYDGYYTDGEYYEDISDDIEVFFDLYGEDSDVEGLLRSALDSLSGTEELLMEQYIDEEGLYGCLDTYWTKLDDEDWLEANAGYSFKEKGKLSIYQFLPNIYTFMDGSLAVFKNTFQNQYQYNQIKKALKEVESLAEDTQIQMIFGVQNERLTNFDLEIGGSESGITDGERVRVEASISQIGKTQIDEDHLAEMLADARAWY